MNCLTRKIKGLTFKSIDAVIFTSFNLFHVIAWRFVALWNKNLLSFSNAEGGFLIFLHIKLTAPQKMKKY